MNQAEKDLEYLNHVLRNNIQLMAAHVKYIEGCLKTMMEALRQYYETLKDDEEELYP